MNASEARVLLSVIAAHDPRHQSRDADDLVLKAAAWADVLEDVPLDAARRAVKAHYSDSNALMLASDVVKFWRAENRAVARLEVWSDLDAIWSKPFTPPPLGSHHE